MSATPTTVDRGNGIAVEKSATQEIPPILKPEAQQAAAQRREAFRYRFPQTTGRWAGNFRSRKTHADCCGSFTWNAGSRRPSPGPWRFPSLR